MTAPFDDSVTTAEKSCGTTIVSRAAYKIRLIR
jgi:hypothetical protein